MNKRRILILAMAAIVSFFVSTNVYADQEEVTQETLDSIVQNCSSIKLQLETVRKNDARMRVHLGQQYETISNRLVIKMNVRLVKNNMPSAEISRQQTQISDERERFRNDYIGYSQEFDTLLKIDCTRESKKFYKQLLLVRSKRQGVDDSVGRLQKITKNHRASIVELKVDSEKEESDNE